MLLDQKVRFQPLPILLRCLSKTELVPDPARPAQDTLTTFQKHAISDRKERQWEPSHLGCGATDSSGRSASLPSYIIWTCEQTWPSRNRWFSPLSEWSVLSWTLGGSYEVLSQVSWLFQLWGYCLVLYSTPQLEVIMVSSFRDHSPLLSCFQTSILCHFIGRGNSILLGGPLRQLFPCLNKDYVSL